MTYQRSFHLHPGARIAGDTERRKVMGKRIAIVGVGAVGGYTGAHMARW